MEPVRSVATYYPVRIGVREVDAMCRVRLKKNKKNNNRYFTWSPIYIFDHTSLSSS